MRHRIEWDRSAHVASQFPQDRKPQVAFAGRSNVGKSSLLNRLFDHRIAQVSQTPGKTRSINFYGVDEWFYMVDLPGYGYAKRPQSERRKYSALIGEFLENNRYLAGVVHLIDIRHDLMELDLRVSGYLRGLDLDVLSVLTKADKLSKSAGARQRQSIARALGADPGSLVSFSAVDGRGTTELWSWILALTEKAKSHV